MGIQEVMLVFLCLLVCKTAASCQKELRDAGIVPKYANQCGNLNLKVSFKDGTEVLCGNSIQISNALNTQTVTVDVKGQCKYLTAIFIVTGPHLHMLYVNVPACALRKGFNPSKSKKGDELASEVYPLAPTNTHRYSFFVYCQQDKIKKQEITIRENFQLKKFAKRNNLGNPIACNFFDNILDFLIVSYLILITFHY